MMITDTSLKGRVFLKQYFLSVSNKSMENPLPLKQVFPLTKLVKLCESKQEAINLFSRLRLKSLNVM